jgi:putative PIN family toxin of toxin-antitoxin system
MKKLHIILDTNCLIQIISIRSKFYTIWKAFLNGKFILCVSNEILNEYTEILERLASVDVAYSVVNTIIYSPFVKVVNPQYRFCLIQQDYDDNKFVDCAISSGASFIVSNDRHFDILNAIEFPKVNVIDLDLFNEFVNSNYMIDEDDNLLLNDSEISDY